MGLFERSWYNRAGVEWVMGFCADEEYWEFLRSCPEFERLLVRGGITLIKYWFSVSDAEQEKRFQARLQDPTSAGSSARWTSRHATGGWTSPRRRTRCSPPRTSPRRPGGSWRPTSRSAPG